MYFGLKQGQITQNIDNRYVLKLIHLVAQCSKITNIYIFHHFPDFCCFLLVMSECPKIHFVALRFILFALQTKFYIRSHHLDTPEDVVDQSLRKWHNHSVRNYDYILKVVGQEHYLYGKKYPLHQFKV